MPVTGTVYDSIRGTPLAGAVVEAVSTGIRTRTDEDGRYDDAKAAIRLRDDFLNFLLRRPDITQENRAPLLILADRLVVEVDVHPPGQRVHDRVREAGAPQLSASTSGPAAGPIGVTIGFLAWPFGFVPNAVTSCFCGKLIPPSVDRAHQICSALLQFSHAR